MIIGIDIGGTHIRSLAREKKTVWGEKIRTPKNLPLFKKTLLTLIRKYLPAGRQVETLDGIGIGVAGYLTSKKIIRSPNARFLDGFRLAEFLRKNLKVPVVMDNDASCFLRAEMTIGQNRNRSSALGITIGTGLGGALARNGKIIRGADLKQGEIGHRPFKNGELEDYASAKFLNRTGDFKKLGENLADGITEVIKTYKPKHLIIGGGVMANPRSSEIVTGLNKRLKTNIKGPKASALKIEVSKLGEFAGALGATLLFKNE